MKNALTVVYISPTYLYFGMVYNSNSITCCLLGEGVLEDLFFPLDLTLGEALVHKPVQNTVTTAAIHLSQA
jgi:hypothetical protein